MTSRRQLVQIFNLAGLALLGYLTFRLLTHPAGGWGFDGTTNEEIGFATILTMIYLPFLWFHLLLGRHANRFLDWLSVLYSVTLLTSFGLALLAYGHATAFLLMAGVLIGWTLWFVSFVIVMRR